MVKFSGIEYIENSLGAELIKRALTNENNNFGKLFNTQFWMGNSASHLSSYSLAWICEKCFSPHTVYDDCESTALTGGLCLCYFFELPLLCHLINRCLFKWPFTCLFWESYNSLAEHDLLTFLHHFLRPIMLLFTWPCDHPPACLMKTFCHLTFLTNHATNTYLLKMIMW